MRKLPILAVALTVAMGAACDSDTGGPDSSRLTLLLTDAPGDFQEAVVTISSIYLQSNGTSDEAGGRVMLRTEPITTNLLELSNDVATLVEGAEIPNGSYGQLRFVIDGAYIVVETAGGAKVYSTPGYAEAPSTVDGELMCPSCGTSGLKVNVVGGLEFDGSSETLIADFDVSESFGHQAGNSGMWIMHPSIKVAPAEDAISLSVNLGLAGGVTLPVIGTDVITLGNFVVELKGVGADEETPGELVTFTDANGDGTFEARFTDVLPGSYQLFIRGPVGLVFTTGSTLPLTINITSDADVTQTIMITSAT